MDLLEQDLLGAEAELKRLTRYRGDLVYKLDNIIAEKLEAQAILRRCEEAHEQYKLAKVVEANTYKSGIACITSAQYRLNGVSREIETTEAELQKTSESIKQAEFDIKTLSAEIERRTRTIPFKA